MKREEMEDLYRRLVWDPADLVKNYSVDDLIYQVQKCKELGLSPKQHQEALGMPRKFVLALWEYVFLDLPEKGIRTESSPA